MSREVPKFSTFKEFWPYYLAEHSKPKTRWIHFGGTTFALIMLVITIATQSWWLLLLTLVSGYGPAWYAHFFTEKNRPATFTYPFWSLAADFKMWFLMLTRRLR